MFNLLIASGVIITAFLLYIFYLRRFIPLLNLQRRQVSNIFIFL